MSLNNVAPQVDLAADGWRYHIDRIAPHQRRNPAGILEMNTEVKMKGEDAADRYPRLRQIHRPPSQGIQFAYMKAILARSMLMEKWQECQKILASGVI